MKKSIVWLVVLILVSTQLSSSANPDSVLISGCVNKKTLTLRIVDKCLSSEKKIQWSQQGPMGNDGNDGADGIDGTNGKDGVDGKDGINGKDGVNGRDGVPGIAGPRGEAGNDGTQVIVYDAYLKALDVLVTGNSKRVLVVKASDLKMPLAAANRYETYFLNAKIRIFTSNPSVLVVCGWQKSADWQTSDVYYGNLWFSYTNNSRAMVETSYVADLNKVDDFFLTCEFKGNGGVSGGYLTAQMVDNSFAGTIGG